MRWNAPNALECADCVGMRRKAPIATFAPSCAVCAELRRLRCWRRIAPSALFAPNCAGIALEFCLAAWHIAICYPVAGAAWLRPRYLQPAVSGSACRAWFLWLTAGSSSRSPAISLQLSVRKINKAGQKLNMLLLPSTQLLFGERPRISPQLTCSCVRTRNSARTS